MTTLDTPDMPLLRRGVHGQHVGTYVGRPSVFGNPFRSAEHGREGAVGLYRARLVEETSKVTSPLKRALETLLETLKAGGEVVLVCWCRLDQECHADCLIEHLTDRLEEAQRLADFEARLPTLVEEGLELGRLLQKRLEPMLRVTADDLSIRVK